MAKIMEVGVSYGETRSANFQGGRVDVSLRAVLTEGEDPDVVREALERQCVAGVEAAFRRRGERLQAAKDAAN